MRSLRSAVPASSCAVSNSSIKFSLSHVNRLLALDLKKQLFRIQVLQNIAASLLRCIYEYAQKSRLALAIMKQYLFEITRSF